MDGSRNIRTPFTRLANHLSPLISSRSNLQFCDIAAYLPDAILEFNPEEKCDFANPSAARLVGLSAERMRGLDVTQLGLPDELSTVSRSMLRRVRDAGEPLSLETVCQYRGKQRHYEARFIPQRAELDDAPNVIMLVRDITEFREAEQKAQLNALRVKQVSRQVLGIQEQSSRHLARELHDEIGQTLTAVKFALQNLSEPGCESQQKILMTHSIEMVSNLLDRIRSLSLDLRPSLLDDLGLEAALRSFVRREAELGQFNVDISFALPGKWFDQDIETTCYRIFQEGLTNVLKYSSATTVWVRLSTDDNFLYGYLADNGKGFDVEKAIEQAIAGCSTGLLSMQERAMLMGGRLHIESDPATGTRHYLKLPLTEQQLHAR